MKHASSGTLPSLSCLGPRVQKKNPVLPSRGDRLFASGAFAVAVAIGCLASTAFGADAGDSNPRVSVTFDHPETFSDLRIYRNRGSDYAEKDREFILGTLRAFIVSRADAYLPAGRSFKIRFTDIRLAGEFTPGGVSDVRFISPRFPPEYQFSWSVTDGSGGVVRKGDEHLFDPSFMDIHGFRDEADKYYFDKAVLDDWMRENLKK